MAKPSVNKVRLWCSSLGVLTAVSITRREAEMKLAAMVPLLQDRYPEAAFTTASMEYVARQCVKGFPTYPELCAHLSGWWRVHRPYIALSAPPPPEPRQPPTPEEAAHVRACVQQITAALASPFQPIEDRRPTARHLTPAQLDLVNPLPNGRKRTDAATAAAPTAVVDADPEAAYAPANDGGDWPPNAA
jgi:hypothetical protein